MRAALWRACGTVVLAIGLCLGRARADDPATAAEPPDPGTPLGAFMLMARSLEAGDAEAALGRCRVTEDDEKDLIAAAAGCNAAHAKLRQSIRAKWGAEAVPADFQLKALSRLFSTEELATAAVTITDDKATLDLPQKRGTVDLVKDGETWRLDLGASLKRYDSKAASTATMYRGWGEEIATAQAELDAGTYESVDDLQADLERKQKERTERESKSKRGGL